MQARELWHLHQLPNQSLRHEPTFRWMESLSSRIALSTTPPSLHYETTNQNNYKKTSEMIDVENEASMLLCKFSETYKAPTRIQRKREMASLRRAF